MRTKTTILLLLLSVAAFAFDAKLTFKVTPATAKIYFNGELKGTGTATYELERAILVEVKIVNEGYVTFYKAYRYGKGSQFAKNEGKGGYERGKNEYEITLDPDPNYVSPAEKEKALNKAAVKSDSINKFITFKYTSADSWKAVTQVVSDYFDENEPAEAGTLKTVWQSQVVNGMKIRTRVIVKPGDVGTYKVKLQSEYSDDQNASVKDDEKFKEWDMELRKYQSMLPALTKSLH